MLYAQTEASIITPAATITGSTQVSLGSEVQIYVIEVTDGTAGAVTNTVYLGNDNGFPVTNGGVQILISDLTVATGFIAADIAELRLYRDSDGAFNGNETFLINETVIDVTGVTPTTLDLQAQALGANRLLPDTPATIFFIVTAVISNSATSGHTFRVGTPVNHLGFHDVPFIGLGSNDVGGAAVAQADGNNIVIAAQSPSFTSGGAGGGVGIPFGGEPVILALLIGTGLYMIRRTSR